MLGSLLLLILIVISVFFVSALWSLWDNNTVFTKVIISIFLLIIFLVIDKAWNISELHTFKTVSAQVSIINSLFSLYFVTVFFNAPSYFGELKGYRLTFKGKVVKIFTQLAAASFAPAMYVWSKTPRRDANLLGFLLSFVFVTFIGLIMFGLIYILICHVKFILKMLYAKTKLHDYINDVFPNLSDGEKDIVKVIKKEGFISIDKLKNPEKFKNLKGLTKYGIPILIYKLGNIHLYTFGDEDDIDEKLISGPIQNCGFYSYNERCLAEKEVIKIISERTGASEKAILKKLEQNLDD